jgi:hypothetical protein
MSGNGILFIDNDALKNFLEDAGIKGKLGADPETQIAQGINALDQLKDWAESNRNYGDSLGITVTVYVSAFEAAANPRRGPAGPTIPSPQR